jgi:O-antigen/teichoic acid export membrane protein
MSAADEAVASARHGRVDVLGRVSWGFADQALSSATNFGLSVAVARTVDPAGFGAFSLVFMAFIVGLNVARPIATEPLSIRYSGAPDARWRRAASEATGTSLTVGIVAGICCLVIGLAAGGELGLTLSMLALTFPGLLLQDAWRFTFFSALRGRAAFLNDLVFTVVLLPALVGLSIQARPSVAAFVLAWGLTASGCALLGIAQGRLVPRPERAMRWLREHADLWPRLGAARAAWVGQSQLSTFSIAAVAGLATVGVFRAADLIFGPIGVAIQGLNLWAIPEGSRLLRRSVGRLIVGCRLLALSLLIATTAWSIVVALIPNSVGEQLLGQLWEPARAILLPMAAAMAGYSTLAGALVGLLVLAAAERYLRVGLVVSAAALVAMTAGAAIGGAAGAAAGAAVALWSGAIVAWWQLAGAAAGFSIDRATDDA